MQDITIMVEDTILILYSLYCYTLMKTSYDFKGLSHCCRLDTTESYLLCMVWMVKMLDLRNKVINCTLTKLILHTYK